MDLVSLDLLLKKLTRRLEFLRPRFLYADLSLCCHDKTIRPSANFLYLKEFPRTCEQVLSTRSLQSYQDDSVMSTGLKLANIRKIKILRD